MIRVLAHVHRCFAVTLLSLCWCAAPAAAAQLPFLTGADTTLANNAGFTLGYQIVVGSTPLQLDSLGLWDEGSDGLAAAHAVGLWNSTGTSLLASVTVPSGTGTTLVDGYRFLALGSPITLAAGTTYVLGAAYNSDDTARDITGFSFANRNTFASPDITLGKGEFEFGASLHFPSGDVSTIYTGPNGLYNVVPEPSSALLAILSGLLLFGFRRPTR